MFIYGLIGGVVFGTGNGVETNTGPEYWGTEELKVEIYVETGGGGRNSDTGGDLRYSDTGGEVLRKSETGGELKNSEFGVGTFVKFDNACCGIFWDKVVVAWEDTGFEACRFDSLKLLSVLLGIEVSEGILSDGTVLTGILWRYPYPIPQPKL